MNTAGFRRELAERGARFVEGKKHTKVYHQGKQSTIPRHKEIPDTLAKLIMKQLGMK
jgi:mRNA interferase HicA